jgi:hypothetical protein
MENKMIELRTDQDFLERLAADHFDDGRGATAADIRAAADYIRNLRDYATNLEREIKRASSDIVVANNDKELAKVNYSDLVAKQTQGADFLFNLIKSDIERLILKEVKDQLELELDYTIPSLEDRIESLETDVSDLNSKEADEDQIKDTVKEMIRDGDITVNIDHM